MIVKLSIKGLHFSYSSVEILRDINLDIRDGQIVSIVGPNGSGKSTLIKCIDRILVPSAGEVIVDRHKVSGMNQMELARMIAYVPQNSLRVFPNTVFDVVLMGRRPHLGWREDPRDEQVVWEVLGLLGIDDLALSLFTNSRGGSNRKAPSRALAQETGVILLDEPTSNLDVWHQIDVMEILKTLVRKQDLTAIIAVHDLNMAARYSDTIIMMKGGKIFATGRPENALTRENLASVYGIHAHVKNYDDIPHVIPLKQIARKRDRA